MKDFNWKKFTRRINIKAPIANIYSAWTKASELERWFLAKAEFFDESGNNIDRNHSVQKGSTYAWSWFLYDAVENGKITEANGHDHIQFTFAGNCIVDILLTSLDNRVTVELCQSNIPTDDNSKKNIRLGCEAGWSFFLVNLKSVSEGGLDLRNKDESLKGMINN